MLAKNFKKSLLAVNIGLAMGAGFSGAAVAADAQTQAKEDVEVIEVRGIRRSLARGCFLLRVGSVGHARSCNP